MQYEHNFLTDMLSHSMYKMYTLVGWLHNCFTTLYSIWNQVTQFSKPGVGTIQSTAICSKFTNVHLLWKNDGLAL